MGKTESNSIKQEEYHENVVGTQKIAVEQSVAKRVS